MRFPTLGRQIFFSFTNNTSITHLYKTSSNCRYIITSLNYSQRELQRRFFSTTPIVKMGRPKVFVSRSDIPSAALAMLKEKCDIIMWNKPCPVPRDYFLENIKGVDAIYCLITDKIDNEVLDSAGPQLKVIGTMSVGHDHLDLPAIKSRGVKVGYTPDVLTDTTAETTLAVLLAASRRLFESHKEILNGGWARSAWGPEYMCGPGLANSTVGIYGMGRIGQAVMSRLIPFKVSKFLYSGRTKKDDVVGAEFVDFDTLCKESDFVIATCAFTPETKEIFNKRAFNLMKPTAVFVNTSRGGVVQQDDLIEALKNDKIFSAGLDVMTPEPLPSDHELLSLRNCVVVPHIGSATIQTRGHMATLTTQNILAALENSPMPQQLC